MTTEKLYSPLEFYMHHPRAEQTSGEYGIYDLYDEQYKISHEEAWESLDAIELTVRRDVDRLDKTHGLAEYFPDELRAKVWSVFPAVEVIGGGLYFAAAVELTAPLTAQETALLKEEISGQWSDGFGEGLEQREIKAWHDTVLYIVPWSSGDGFFIDTEREFRRRLGLEPIDPVVADESVETAQSGETATTAPPVIPPAADERTVTAGILTNADLPDTSGKGYLFAVCDDSDFYIPNALHVERNDAAMMFISDADAAKAAAMDGVPFIGDIAGVYPGVYIDTSENRAVIAQWQEELRQGALAPDEAIDAFHSRLDKNLEAFRVEMLQLPRADIIDSAAHIVRVYQTHGDLRSRRDFTVGQTEFLLLFADPLQMLVHETREDVAGMSAVRSVMSDKAHTLENPCYARAADNAQTPAQDAPKLVEPAREEQGGYTSVLGKINADKAAKRARKAEQERDGGRDGGRGDAPTPKRKRGDAEI